MKRRHEHELRPAAVYANRGSIFGAAGVPQTVVLFRCYCLSGIDSIATKTINGYFTLKEITEWDSDRMTSLSPEQPETTNQSQVTNNTG
jgi:hypothetical protein